MWTWSISAGGARDAVIDSVTAQSFPLTETNGEGVEVPRTFDSAEVVMYDQAKSAIIAAVSACDPLAYVAVGVSGNAAEFSSLTTGGVKTSPRSF